MSPSTELLVRAIIRVDDRLLVVRERGRDFVFLPGGHVEPGEPVRAALTRELIEELGIDARVGAFAGVVEHAYRVADGPRHELNLLFAVPLSRAAARVVRSREDHLTVEWVPGDRLADTDLRPGTLRDALLEGGAIPFWRSGVRSE